MASDLSLYSIIWLKSAHKDFEKFPTNDQKSIIKKIDLLITVSYDILDIKKLKGHADLYRLRVGDYRVVFGIDKQNKEVCIAAVGHRRDIYIGLGH